ncbi:MAG: hypothetical protein CMN30_05345 [Sandaracinus sp.]|nr:hypothetical protein [Sandaracinus sp.]
MRVSIVQEYVPAYRRPFFDLLDFKCRMNDLQFSLFAGTPQGSQRLRADHDTSPRQYEWPINQRELRLFGRRLTFRNSLSAFKSDLVILEQARRNIDAYFLLFPKGMRGDTRLALWGHGLDHVGSPSTLERLLLRSLASRSDHLFAYTSVGAGYFTNECGLDARRVTVVNNSIDTRHLASDLDSIGPIEVDGFKKSLGIGDSDSIVLYMGGLDDSKNIPLLLDAHSRMSSVHLLVAGAGSSQDKVASYCRSSQATYLGPLSGREKAVALRASALILNPGRVGLIAVDSIVSGVPIVTSAAARHAPEYEYVADGASFTVDGDPENFASLTMQLLTGFARIREAEAELTRRRPNFSIESMTDNFMDGIKVALGLH